MPRHNQRGSALLITLIALGVLMLLVVAAIQFTGINREGASSKLRSDELAGCAESARRALMDALNQPGISLSGKTYTFTLLDQSDVTERSNISTIHYTAVDAGFDPDAGVQSDTPAVISAASAVPTRGRDVRDLSNAAPSQYGFGGVPYRVVMTCRDRGGRETEVEFLFKYGF